MAFLRYRDNLTIQYVAILFSSVIACCPVVDYYCNWYVTLIPIAIVAFPLLKTTYLLSDLVKTLFFALLFVLIQYWVVYRQQDFLVNIRNGMMAFTPIITAYFLKEKASFQFKKAYLQMLVVLMLITAITTIMGLQVYPEACRELAGSHETEQAEIFLRMNIGGFDYIYAVVVFIPVLFWLIKNTKGNYKRFNIISTCVLLYCVYLSSYTTALLLSIMALALVLIERKPSYRPYIISALVLFLLFAGTGLLSDFILGLSRVVGSEYVSDRLLQLSMVLGGADINSIQTQSSTERLELLQSAKDGFLNSPIWGNNLFEYSKEVISGHSIVFDLLSGSGLIGVGFCILLFVRIFRKAVAGKSEILTPCTRAVWILFIIASATNPSGFFLVYLVAFTATRCVQSLTNEENGFE